jgi:hypothetical protein
VGRGLAAQRSRKNRVGRSVGQRYGAVRWAVVVSESVSGGGWWLVVVGWWWLDGGGGGGIGWVCGWASEWVSG